MTRRAGITDVEELDLFYDYFWGALCGAPLSSDSWVNSFLVFRQGYHGNTLHSGIYGRRPLATEPRERLQLLPPTSVIFGDRDWIYTPSVADAVRLLPNGHLHVEPGGSHHLYHEQPAKFHELALVALQNGDRI